MAPRAAVNDLSAVPMYNPYHRFSWSQGFKVFPALASPYKSSSGELIVEFSPPANRAHQAAQLGVGSFQANACFRFDFSGFRAGCNSTSASCNFNITGLAWNSKIQTEVPVASHIFTTRSCRAQKGCELSPIAASKAQGLTNLTSILIDVTAAGQPQTWWADDIALKWTDTSCESAICRSHVRDTVTKRGRRPGFSRILETLP